MRFLIQASSTSWSGEEDECVGLVDGKPLVHWTALRVLQSFDDSDVVVIAPAFDEGGILDSIAAELPKVRILYGHDDDPLARMLDATRDMDGDAFFLRTNGLNLFFDVEAVHEMCATIAETKADCIKFPDDYPVHFTSEAYRVSALRSLAEELEAADAPEAAFYRVHPRYLFFRPNRYLGLYIGGNLPYPDALLRRARETVSLVQNVPRKHLILEKSIQAGDRLGYHYDLACEYLRDGDTVLDIACGDGYGTAITAERRVFIIGADLDEEVIAVAKQKHSGKENMRFEVQDALALTYENESFDAILSMETVEHVPDEEAYFREMRRVLKRGGRLLLSTPQNSSGRIPCNAIHTKEYSLKELQDLASRYFSIERTIGFKAGRVFFDDDPLGTNTFLVLRKPPV